MAKSAFDRQVGGEYYLRMSIPFAQFVLRNGLGAGEAMVIKYVCRWRQKGGVGDLRKAVHWLEMMIEAEEEKIHAKR